MGSVLNQKTQTRHISIMSCYSNKINNTKKDKTPWITNKQNQLTSWYDPTPSKEHGQRILFTGPDGMYDQEMEISNEHRYIGIGTMSKEGTSELDFLYRQGPNPEGQSYFAMKRKHQTIASIGWGYEDAAFLNKKLTDETQNNLQRGEFRQAAEDRYTHLYQSPYYEDPNKKQEKKKVKSKN